MSFFDLTEPAENDLVEIYQAIAEEDADTAARIIDEFFAIFQLLATQRNAGRNRPELLEGVQSFYFRRHVIFFRKSDIGVMILRVLHEKRDTLSIFEQ